jgi:hypothetical protein
MDKGTRANERTRAFLWASRGACALAVCALVLGRCAFPLGLCLWLDISACVALSRCGACSCVGARGFAPCVAFKWLQALHVALVRERLRFGRDDLR